MAAGLRRGFKAEAERISLAVRTELGLAAHDRLDCLNLAAHLGIPVVSLVELRRDGASSESIDRLLTSDAGFSALTVCAGTRRLIVYNPRHPPGRRANSLAHELSHIILENPPAPALGDGGCRRWDAQLEGEADWLAGALLVPREGALAWLRRGGNQQNGAQHFGVSRALFQWRVSQTGVARQLASLPQRKTLRGASPMSSV
jgi:hypothetical protein